VALECRYASVLIERNRIEPESISLGEPRGSLLEVRREPASITVEFPNATTPEALVHPLLALPISILARWRGDLTLHAGGFFAAGRAWGMIGVREAGKSTMLAKLAQSGCPLLADDLLVLDDGVVRAGPACIDLRPDVAERIPGARFLGEVGERPRYRLATPHGPSRAELGGLFLLEWSEGSAIEVEPVPASEALQVIHKQEYIGVLGPTDPKKVMQLLATPVWRLRRPRDWTSTDEAVAAVLDVTARSGA
jgi:hypothetical protein